MKRIFFIFLLALSSVALQAQTKTFVHEGKLTDSLGTIRSERDALIPYQIIGYGTSTVGGTSKVISDPQVEAGAIIIATPLGALINAGTLSVDNVQDGQFTLRSTNFLDSRNCQYIIFKEN